MFYIQKYLIYMFSYENQFDKIYFYFKTDKPLSISMISQKI